MATKLCASCIGTRGICTCDTSPVSEIIAEAIADYGQKFGGYGVQHPEWPRNDKESREHEWLRTTLNRVASVAREEGMNQSDLEEIYKDKIEFGAQAMKDKILAAIEDIRGDADTTLSDVIIYNTALTDAQTTITDLK